ncbi:hypothetical protein TNCV_3141121 [Trichonephila clavipes]|nr:hypothetical protein TNCV_3141121 [Trichonephila clavipes]
MIMHDLTELGLLRSIWRIMVWNEWNDQLEDLNPIEHLWDYLGRGCCFKQGRYKLKAYSVSGLRFLFRCPTT